MKTAEQIIRDGKKYQLKIIEWFGNIGGTGRLTINGIRSSVVWSTDGGWDHVSVSPIDPRMTPKWDFMCELKNLFFNEDETVVQYHPQKEDYVNIKQNCLHLWKPTKAELPIPPKEMVY